MGEGWLDKVKWDEDGLVPAIAQEASTNKVLTLAWMNRESLAKTVATGEAHYWSRSRMRLWKKGEQSGHVQKVCEIRLDCDEDAARRRIVGEPADLWFHCLIMLAQYGLRPADVLAELRRREGISGIDEKAARAEGRRAEAERK